MIRDGQLMFTGVGTSGFAPTATGDNVAPFTIDTAPLGLPTGSGGASTPGYKAGSSVNAGRDLGLGGAMWWYVLVTVAVTQSGGGGVFFELATDSNATISNVATAANILIASPNFAAATMIAGFRFATQLPASLIYLEWLGVNVDIVTNILGAGTFESGLVTNLQASDLYDTG